MSNDQPPTAAAGERAPGARHNPNSYDPPSGAPVADATGTGGPPPLPPTSGSGSGCRSEERVVPTEKILKDLMLGFIYPAVLGTVLYLVLAVVAYAAATITDAMLAWELRELDLLLILKVTLLLVTLAFYLCDYLYLTFTNTFERHFFWYDCVFLFTLFVTVTMIRTDTDDRRLPQSGLIAACYLVFMFLYRRWDELEWKRCPAGDEQDLFKDVLTWERHSAVALAAAGLLAVSRPSSIWSTVVLLLIVSYITLHFQRLVRRKRSFYRTAA